MARWRVHKSVTRMILGEDVAKATEKLHYALDFPAFYMRKGHRRFFHDPLSAMLMGEAIAGEKGAWAGLLHVLVDKACVDPAVERVFEALAKSKI